MIDNTGHKAGSLLEYYKAVLLLLALFMLTFIGVGNITFVALIGLILCIAGIGQKIIRIDVWIVAPLLMYNGISMVSSYVTYGNIYDGFAPMQMILLTIYLLAGSLGSGEIRWLKRASVVWAAIVSAVGICEFVYLAIVQSASRMESIMGNPNALGIFLVIGWFALMDCNEEQLIGKYRNKLFLQSLEPILLSGLALTLSMGSFVAMAAGVVVMALYEKRRASWQKTLAYIGRVLAKASYGMGIGILMYIAADKTDAPWLCFVLLIYLVAAALYWHRFEDFLTAYKGMANIITASGLVVAVMAVLIRPSAISTFTERIEMIRNGLGYITKNPLLGIGPYQWRVLNLFDGDKYFNTWHIHNALIHVGVELGLVAMAMLVIIVIRFYRKKSSAVQKSEFTAFFVHNLIDASFFYLSIVSLVIMTEKDTENSATAISGIATKLFFGGIAVLFAYFLYCSLI